MKPEIMSEALIILVLSSLVLLVLLGCDSVVNRFAFFPDTADVMRRDELPPDVQEVFIEARDGVKLQCYYLPRPGSKRLLVYFHGNAGNIGHRLLDLLRLRDLGIHVLALSYRGYGRSEGRPSEKGIYLDGEGAVRYATEELGFPHQQMFLMGRSIGTTVAVHTAQQMDLAGLILVSPLTSGRDHARAHGFGPLSAIAGRSFDNISKMPGIRSPLLVIHGTRDRVIPLPMGKRIHDAHVGAKRLVTVEGAGHNDLSDHRGDVYWREIGDFIGRMN